MASLVYLPLVLVAAVAGSLLFGQRTRQDGSAAPAARWAQIALIALTLLYFVKGMVRVGPLHRSLAIISSVVLTVIAFANFRAARSAWRAALAAALALVVAFTCSAFETHAAIASGNLRALMTATPQSRLDPPVEAYPTSCDAVTGLQHLGCYSLDQDHMSAPEFLQAHTRPGDYIYMGLGRHHKIFINDVTLYFLAKLRSATKWAQFDPGLQTSAPIQREMIGELARTPPRYVVLESQWDDVEEPNASGESSGIALLDDYIRQNFRLVATFGTITVLERLALCP